MAFCPNCGAQVPDGTTVCPQCGAQIAAAGQPQQGQPQQGQPQPNYQRPNFQQAPYQQPPYRYQQAPDPKDHTAEFDPQDISDNKVFAMAAYLMGTLGAIIALLAAQKSPYAMFHVRQALKISMCEILLVIIAIIPIVGWIFSGVCTIILLVVRIILFFQVCHGKAKEAPIVGSLGFLK